MTDTLTSYKKKIISVAEDFAKYPGGYFDEYGLDNGESFRRDHLIPAILSRVDMVEVDLNGTEGYASSFLEEAFGGLTREGFDPERLRSCLTIVSDDTSLIQEIWDYIDKNAYDDDEFSETPANDYHKSARADMRPFIITEDSATYSVMAWDIDDSTYKRVATLYKDSKWDTKILAFLIMSDLEIEDLQPAKSFNPFEVV